MPDASTADRVADLAREHYGHLGPRVVEHVAAEPPEVWLQRYRDARSRLQDEHPGHERAAGIVALLELAAAACRAVGVPQPTCDVWSWLWGHIRAHAAASSQAAAAWRVVAGRVHAERQAGRMDGSWPAYGTVVEWLQRAGYGRHIVGEWAALGWVETEPSTGHLVRAYQHGVRVRVVRPTEAAPH